MPPLFRPSRDDQQTPVDRQNQPKPILRRGNTSNREQRPLALARTDSRDNRPGQWKDADRGPKRSQNRSSSTPPSRTRHRPPQDGRTMLLPASANASWEYGERWVNTSWFPGGFQSVQVQMSGQMVVHGGGQFEDDHRGRPRRSSDAKRPNPVQSGPPPKPAYSTPSSPAQIPVIPGFTTSGGMGIRNLLRKSSRDRPKILFYHKHEPYYGFTNFSPHPVTYEEKVYPTSEHLFQAFKVSPGGGKSLLRGFFFFAHSWIYLLLQFTHKPNLMEHIRTCDPRPSVAFAEARRFAHEVHPNWKNDNIKKVSPPFHCASKEHKC
jgi:hypothetical protein